MTTVHIHAPAGHYIGQVCKYGCRAWLTVTGNYKTGEAALSKAVSRMYGYQRARALFIDDSGWYTPTVHLEAKR